MQSPGAAPLADSTAGEAALYLHPGQVFVSAMPTIVTTILATCVAICVWDEGSRIGGINHYLLAWEPPAVDRTARYGPIAFRELLGRLVAEGAKHSRLQAKVFGGVVRRTDGERLWRDQGSANSELALRLLAQEGIPVRAKDVGGARARKLVFRTDTGEGWVKYL